MDFIFVLPDSVSVAMNCGALFDAVHCRHDYRADLALIQAKNIKPSSVANRQDYWQTRVAVSGGCLAVESHGTQCHITM